MNIQSTRRMPSSLSVRTAAQNQKPDPQEPAKSYADSVSIASKNTAGIAGALAGAMLGWKGGIEVAYAMGVSDATAILLAGLAVGGWGGAMLGSHGSQIAERVGGAAAEKLGVSRDTGRIVGATAVSALMGGVLGGSPLTAAIGGGVALGVGGIIHAAK